MPANFLRKMRSKRQFADNKVDIKVLVELVVESTYNVSVSKAREWVNQRMTKS